MVFLLGLETLLLTGRGKYQRRSCLAWGKTFGSQLKAGESLGVELGWGWSWGGGIY